MSYQVQENPETRIGHFRRLVAVGSPAILIGICLLVAGLFVVTSLASKAFHHMQARMAQQWFTRGETELQAGRAQTAIHDFRNAIAYDRSDRYFLKLAQALILSGDYPEAHGYLLNLWDEHPGDGTLNLQLARLSARTGPTESAVRYYQNAIYGLWDSDPPSRRREVRFELAEYLLDQHRQADAEADLISLIPDLPSDAVAHSRAGQLLARAGDNGRALAEFQTALKLDPDSLPAIEGSGRAAFAIGNYPLAKHYLQRALRADQNNPSISSLLQTADAVISRDPMQLRLSNAERAKRLASAWNQALSRINDCALQKGYDFAKMQSAPQPLGPAYSALMNFKPNLAKSKLRAHPELLDTGLAAIARAETAAADVCGSSSPADLALILISRMHGAAQ